jgi:SAM-dependent methyltransferase
MYREAARFYDVILDAQGRDAQAEAELVIGEIRRRTPSAKTLLDAGCGTGAHLSRFSTDFDACGVDASHQMLAIAAQNAPDVPLAEGDFRTFQLNRTFDAIVCLFSGIGYLTEEADLQQAVANMVRHLRSGGVLLIEGWIEPEYWIGNTVHAESARRGRLAVARATRSWRDGPHSVVEMRYVGASPEVLTTIDENHRMRLSHPEEFARAYEREGLSFERLPHMLHPGRSVYAGILPRRTR